MAFWTGFTAFFGNLAGIKVLEWIGEEGDIKAQAIGALLISIVVGAVAYGRERLKEEKEGWDGEDRRAPERRAPPGPTP